MGSVSLLSLVGFASLWFRCCMAMPDNGKMQPASFFLSSLVYFCQEHSCAAGIWLAHQLLLSLPRIFGCKANLSKSLPLIRSASRTEVSPEISFVNLVTRLWSSYEVVDPSRWGYWEDIDHLKHALEAGSGTLSISYLCLCFSAL